MSVRNTAALARYRTGPTRSLRARWSLPEGSPPEPRPLDRVRQALRARHLSRRTEEAYVAWHPALMGAPEVALSALLFLYKEVLELDLPYPPERLAERRKVQLRDVMSWRV